MLDNQNPSQFEVTKELLGHIRTMRVLLEQSTKAGIAVPFETAKLIAEHCAVIEQSERYSKRQPQCLAAPCKKPCGPSNTAGTGEGIVNA